LKNKLIHIKQYGNARPGGQQASTIFLKNIWMLVLYVFFIQTLNAEQIDIGIFKSETPNKAEIKIMPDFQINAGQTITGIMYTIRWDDPSVSLQPDYIFPFFIPVSGDTVHHNGYIYQVFAATPMIALANDILPGEEVLVSSFSYTGSNCTFFEIIENDWTSANNAGYYCELLGSDKTGIIYHSFIDFGSVGGYVVGGGNIFLGENTGLLILNDHTGTVLQWQKQLNNAAWENIDGTFSLTVYSEVPIEAGIWKYRAIIQNSDCQPVFSEPATVLVMNASAWTGLAGSAWNEPVNWTAGIPGPTTNIIIQEVGSGSYPIISGQAECMDITIQQGASLVVEAAAAFTVHGDFMNHAGSEAFIIQSNVGGTGSLIHHSAGVQATVQHYMPGWNTWPAGQQETHGRYLLSSMTESQPIQPGFVSNPPTGDEVFYKWNEEIPAWVNSAMGITPPYLWNPDFETEFLMGRGYLSAYNQTTTHVFEGQINVNDIHFTGLTHTTGHDMSGWHLLGNPFASAVNWFHDAWDRVNIGTYAQFWDQESASYRVMLNEGYIPAGSGFMVYCTAGGNGSLTLPATARIHNGDNRFKSLNEEKILLVANDSEGATAQQTIIKINPDASFSFDPAHDALFLEGYAPVFYSRSQDQQKLALNTIPYIGDGLNIELGFIKNNSGTFTIELLDHISDYPVVLYDIKLNIWHNLIENPIYAFSSEDGDDPARFMLYFETVGIENQNNDHISVYTCDRYLYVSELKNLKNRIEIFDLAGRKVEAFDFTGGNRQSFPLNLVPGIYLVKIQNSELQFIQKIIIQK
jgi:hypothetical protein